MDKQLIKLFSSNELIYHYIRGSHAYGMNTKESDTDTAGWFVCAKDILYGLSNKYVPQLHDEKNDNVFYEIGEAMSLLLKSNPNMIESLYIPKRCILRQDEIVSEILDNKDIFLSKEIYSTFGGYAKSQIHKMIGLNKAIVNPVNERLTPLDFCYTFYKQGSTKLSNWLEYRGLKEKYCGLVNIANMQNIYGLYYDLGSHIINEFKNSDNVNNILLEEGITKIIKIPEYLKDLIFKAYGDLRYIDFTKIKPIGYRGILNEDKTSNELRLSSIPKFEMPLCQISYNENGYTKHCVDYKRYNEWKKNRNPIRYEHNLKQNYDTKNASHMIRLVRTCTEALNGEGVNIDRKNIDAGELISIKQGNMGYDELKELMDKETYRMDEAYKNTKLKDNINIYEVNQLLIDIRNKFYERL